MEPRVSQQSGISAAFKKLCKSINQGKTEKGDIGYAEKHLNIPETSELRINSCPLDALNFLKEALRSHRNKGTTIEPAFANTLVAEIEKAGENICDRLEVSVYCIVVDIMLQSDYSRAGERGINLLAVRTSSINRCFSF